MKKRLLSIILLSLPLIMLLSGCFGSKEPQFDLNSFMEDDFFTVDYDEMMGQAYIEPADVAKNAYRIQYDERHTIDFEPFIYVDGPVSVYGIMVIHTANGGWYNLDKLIVKIDDKNYIFSKLDLTQTVDGSTYMEAFYILIDNKAMPFIESFVEHQDETIRVNITTEWDTFNFVLPEEIKTGVAKTFERFDAAGGTSKANMKIITNGVKKDKVQRFKTEKAD